MGVPVITKTGNTFAGRHSTSHLNAVGLTDWIVKENEAYVALAQGKANDKESLRALRQTLRDTMAASPICDAQSFTRSLENAYREMWAHACTSGVAGDVPRVMDIAADS
jgi:protein O-GlcNAc transferase